MSMWNLVLFAVSIPASQALLVEMAANYVSSTRIAADVERKEKLRDDMIRVIETVRPSGDFCVGGRIAMPSPHLSIDGAGVMALPLQQYQVNTMKQVATQAPFGKGSETLIDLAVRDSLQISAAQTMFSNPDWDAAVQKLANDAGLRMGLESGKVIAKLDKLLLYGPGGHFKAHKDSEKAPGMFGSLVLQFPCEYEGGYFHVRHSGLDRTFQMDKENAHEYHYVAFYADCEHEIEPVVTGNRITATYCLCWKEDGVPPCAPSMEAALLLSRKLKEMGNETFGILFKHTYTTYTISRYGWKALKGIDRKLAGTVHTAMTIAAKEDPAFKMHFYFCELYHTKFEGEYECSEEKTGIRNLYTFEGMQLRPSSSLKQLEIFDDILNYQYEEMTDSEEEDREGGSQTKLEDLEGQIDKQDETKSNNNDEKPWMYSGDVWKLVDEGAYTGNEATPNRYGCWVFAFRRENGNETEEEYLKKGREGEYWQEWREEFDEDEEDGSNGVE